MRSGEGEIGVTLSDPEHPNLRTKDLTGTRSNLDKGEVLITVVCTLNVHNQMKLGKRREHRM